MTWLIAVIALSTTDSPPTDPVTRSFHTSSSFLYYCHTSAFSPSLIKLKPLWECQELSSFVMVSWQGDSLLKLMVYIYLIYTHLMILVFQTNNLICRVRFPWLMSIFFIQVNNARSSKKQYGQQKLFFTRFSRMNCEVNKSTSYGFLFVCCWDYLVFIY